MVEKIKIKLDQLIDEQGYKLWFGSKNAYQANKDWGKNEVILEPFITPLKKHCPIETNFTLWVLKANEFGGESLQVDARDYDKLRKDALNIVEAINADESFSIPKKLYELDVEYSSANSSVTTNNQSVLKMTFPIQIWI